MASCHVARDCLHSGQVWARTREAVASALRTAVQLALHARPLACRMHSPHAAVLSAHCACAYRHHGTDLVKTFTNVPHKPSNYKFFALHSEHCVLERISERQPCVASTSTVRLQLMLQT
jgi:hypothetical protein